MGFDTRDSWLRCGCSTGACVRVSLRSFRFVCAVVLAIVVVLELPVEDLLSRSRPGAFEQLVLVRV